MSNDIRMLQKIYQSNRINQLRAIKHDCGYKLHDLKRLLLYKSTLETIINEREIRVIGLRRTGNHGIMNWIKYQYNDNHQRNRIFHLNNIEALKNPYRERYKWDKQDFWRQEALGNFTDKSCLMCSYEDYSLEQIIDSNFERKHDLYFGKSKIRYDVLIIRDIFNFIASRLKRNYLTVKTANQTFVSLWIEYAKEFLGETHYLQNNKICINYNQWFSDINYRKHIASLLELKFTDAGLNVIKGGGSSFNIREFDGKANQMNILKRWEYFKGNQDFINLINNQELLEYSEKIFGFIPGTEQFYQKF